MSQSELIRKKYSEFVRDCETYIPLKKRYRETEVRSRRVAVIDEYKVFLSSNNSEELKPSVIESLKKKLEAKEREVRGPMYEMGYVGPFKDRDGDYYLTLEYREEYVQSFSVIIDSHFGKRTIKIAGDHDLDLAIEIYSEITEVAKRKVEISFSFVDEVGKIDLKLEF